MIITLTDNDNTFVVDIRLHYIGTLQPTSYIAVERTLKLSLDVLELKLLSGTLPKQKILG